MKQYNHSLWMTPLLGALLLVGCGSDGKDGEDGAPGEVGLTLASARDIAVQIDDVSIDGGTVVVNFSLTNKNGVAITDLDTYAGVDTLGVGIAKLVPQSGKGYKTPQWVSYINRVVEPVAAQIPAGYEDKAGTQIQANIESSCRQECIEKTGNGSYSYTFKQNIASVEPIEGLDLSYDANLTHRVSFELRVDGSTDKLVNSHYDFIPATGQVASGEETRLVENLQDSCLRCHSSDYGHAWAPKLIFHGSRRFDTPNCQVCHTSYAADPETGSPLDFGYMLHQIHRGKYLMVGYGGSVHDFSEVTFPADAYDCRVCHQEGENRPVDAANFRHHRALACGSCHVDSTDPATIKAEMHAKYQPDHACSTCHADKDTEGAGHHFTDAIAKDNVRLDYQAALVADSVRLEAGMLKFAVSVKDSKGAAQPSPNADPRIKYSTLYLGFGNEEDFTAGHTNVNLLNLTPVSGADGIYQYENAFSLTVDPALPSSAFITSQMCVDRDTLAGVACGSGSDEALNPSVIPGAAVVFNLQGDTGLQARRSVVKNSTCDNCHDNKYLAKFESKMTHSGRRSNFEGECQTCHNPLYSASSANKEIQDHIDFKVRIHAHHAGKRTDEDPITFPEHYGNCASCHNKGSLTLTGLAKVPATPAIDANGNEVEFSPIAAACISCHGPKDSLLAHVRANGGVASDVRGSFTPGSETCAVCHGEGKAAGVDSVHPVRYK